MSKKLTYNEQLSLIEDKNNGIKVKELSEKYQIAECTVYNIVRRGAKEYKIANKKYSVNSEYFKEINTEEKAYWLGFLYADGYVRMKYNRSGELRLKLGRKDRHHIELFTKCLESNHPIKDTESIVVINDKEHKSDVSLVSIYNTEIVQDLYKHGCTNKKTFTIEFPELREDLIRHFIRGYFDGDGHISIEKGYNFGRVGLTSGSHNFVISLVNILKSFDISTNITERETYYICEITNKNNIYKFEKFIYTNSTISLYRKKEKFDMIDYTSNFYLK